MWLWQWLKLKLKRLMNFEFWIHDRSTGCQQNNPLNGVDMVNSTDTTCQADSRESMLKLRLKFATTLRMIFGHIVSYNSLINNQFMLIKLLIHCFSLENKVEVKINMIEYGLSFQSSYLSISGRCLVPKFYFMRPVHCQN